tara:strand:+ start:1945 stop:2646 length:702 start_codon:yes stop_codon:yes gene_type:complete
MDKNILEELKLGFDSIKTIRLKIKDELNSINSIKCRVKNKYINCIKKEKNNFFGLDSVFFQTKLIELEYDNLSKLYSYIDNRIYGDYYKLFIMIKNFLQTTLNSDSLKLLNQLNIKYPIYKDLDYFKEYNFDIINNIHRDIINIISIVNDIYKKNENEMNDNMDKVYIGINIDNYIINQEHINKNLFNTNVLYTKYLNIYHNFHKELLDNYFEKLNLYNEQIHKTHYPNVSNI